MLRVSVIILLLLTCVNSWAQSDFFGSFQSSFKEKPKLLIKLESRNSFVATDPIKTREIQLGLNFDNTVKLGLGYNWLGTNYEQPLAIVGEEIQDGIGELKMRYLSPFVEYTYLKTKNYALSVPLQVGMGRGFYKYKLTTGEKKETERNNIAFLEPGMSFEYYFLRYFSFGVGFGYRLMINGSRHYEGNFNAPFYAIRFKIHFSKVAEDMGIV